MSFYKGLVALSALSVIYYVLEQYIGKFGASRMQPLSVEQAKSVEVMNYICYWKIIVKNNNDMFY